jgi:signal transduction histidine kinase/DNA-binding NarL/FixJ family response regulator
MSKCSILVISESDLGYRIINRCFVGSTTSFSSKTKNCLIEFNIVRALSFASAIELLNCNTYDVILFNLDDDIPQDFEEILANLKDVIYIGLLNRFNQKYSILGERLNISDIVVKDTIPDALLNTVKVAVLENLVRQQRFLSTSTSTRETSNNYKPQVLNSHVPNSLNVINTFDRLFLQYLAKSTFGVLILNSEREILYYNESAADILDLNNHSASNNIAVDKIRLPFFLPNEATVFHWCPAVNRERIVSVAPTKLEYLVNDRKDEVFLCTLRDISARTIHERESKNSLKRLKEEIDLLRQQVLTFQQSYSVYRDDLKSRDLFFATMSHEIRTPLTSIIGYTDLLLSSHRSLNEQRDALQAVLQNGHHLQELLGNILDFSRVEAEALVIEKDIVSPFLILAEIESTLALRAQAKGIFLQIKNNFPLPEKICTDRVRLKQILINVIGNAIKFTKNGGITISASYDTTTEELIFDIEDTGIGIPLDLQNEIFQSYRSGGYSFIASSRGFGLGLYVSQRLAKLLNGELKLLKSTSNGSLFSLSIKMSQSIPVRLVERLPSVDVLSKTRSILNPVQTISARILVAEDAPDARKLVSLFLREAGIDAYFACDGEEAMDMVVTSRVSYDIILMDMQMPKIDGYEAVATLRSYGFKNPIIAFTAGTSKEELERALAIGCNDTLPKPFNRNELLGIINRFLSEKIDNPPQEITVVNQILEQWLPEEAMNLLNRDNGLEVLISFIRETKKRYLLINKAIKDDNKKLVKKILHQLQGTAMFGFRSLSFFAREAYEELEKVASVTEAEKSLEKVVLELKQVARLESLLTNQNLSNQETFTPPIIFD